MVDDVERLIAEYEAELRGDLRLRALSAALRGGSDGERFRDIDALIREHMERPADE